MSVAKNEKKRILGLDIVRVIAILFVICVHYFLNNGFYVLILNNKLSFVMLYFRWLFYTCVPLFLILTGYLKCNKKIDNNYYKGIVHILISYIFIECIIFLFKNFYLHENISITRYAINMLGFEVSDYSWYVEMYIGLFLMIPFLNLIYNGLKNKKEKELLIITFLCLTGLPSIFSNMSLKINIFPDYWVGLYPITYYFIGCYLKEYKLKFNKLILVCCTGLLLFFQTVFTFFYSYNDVLDWNNFMGGFGSIITTGVATLIFLTLYDIDIKNITLSKIISKISICSFDMYLLSYIVDKIIYPKIDFSEHFSYIKYSYIPLLVFLISLILALIKDIIFKIILILYRRLVKKNYEKENKQKEK